MGTSWDELGTRNSTQRGVERKRDCREFCFEEVVIEAEDWESRKSDGESAERRSRVEEWGVERRCKEMRDEGFQGKGKAGRQSAGFGGNGGEEEERKDNPDRRWAAERDDGWAANRKTKVEEGKMEIKKRHYRR